MNSLSFLKSGETGFEPLKACFTTKQERDRTDKNLHMRFEKKQLPFMRSVKESWLRYRADENSLFLSKKNP